MAKSREANIVVSVSGADASKQNLDKVRQALENAGDEGKKASQKLVDSFRNIEAGEERLEKKISSGRAVSTRDATVMIQAMANLDAQLKKTFGSIANAPTEIQEAFKKAEGSLDRTKAKVRDLTDAVQDQAGTLKEGGEQWGGLENAIGKAAGQYGKIVAGAGLVAAAFKEGFDIGMKLNKFFGTDMQAWADFTKEIGSRIFAIVSSLADNIKGTASVVMAVMSGHFALAKEEMGKLADTNAQSQDKIKHALTDTNSQWADYAKSIGIATETARENAEADKKLAEEKGKLAASIGEVVRSLQAETLELEKQKIIAEESDLRAIDRTGQLVHYKSTLDGATSAVAAQREEVARLTAAHGSNDPMMLAAIEKLAILEQGLRSARERYQQTSEEVKKYEAQQRAAEAAVQAASQKIAELNTKQAELSGSTKAATDAGEKVPIIWDAATRSFTNVGEAAKKAASADEGIGKLGEVVKEQAVHLDKFLSALERIVTAQNQARTGADELAASLLKVGEAAAFAAGDENQFVNTSEAP